MSHDSFENLYVRFYTKNLTYRVFKFRNIHWISFEIVATRGQAKGIRLRRNMPQLCYIRSSPFHPVFLTGLSYLTIGYSKLNTRGFVCKTSTKMYSWLTVAFSTCQMLLQNSYHVVRMSISTSTGGNRSVLFEVRTYRTGTMRLPLKVEKSM